MPHSITDRMRSRLLVSDPLRARLHELLVILVAVLLLLAAALKVHEMIDNRFMDRTWPILQVAGELALALWLLSGLWRLAAWAVTLAVLSVFIVYTAGQFIAGAPSCGCFGVLVVPPAVTLAIDSAMLLGLLWLRPPARLEPPPGGKRRRKGGAQAPPRPPAIDAPRVAVVGFCGGLAGIAAAVVLIQQPAVPAESRSALDAGRLVAAAGEEQGGDNAADPQGGAEPPPQRVHHHLGYLEPGEATDSAFELANPSDTAITIERYHNECRCTKLKRKPDTIEAGSSVRVPFDFEAPQQRSDYARRVIFHTDHPDAETITVTISARIGLPLQIGGRMRRSVEGEDAGDIPGDPDPAKVTWLELTNHGDEPAPLLYGGTDRDGVVPLVPREPVPAGGSVHLPVRWTQPPGDEAERLTVTLRSGLAHQRRVRAAVRLDSIDRKTE